MKKYMMNKHKKFNTIIFFRYVNSVVFVFEYFSEPVLQLHMYFSIKRN